VHLCTCPELKRDPYCPMPPELGTRSHEFSTVVMDQLLLDAEPEDVDTILKQMGTAVPVYSNFALSRIERVSRELRSALHRFTASPAQARIAGSKAEGGTGIAQRTEGFDHGIAAFL
jgi:hypothetical protein